MFFAKVCVCKLSAYCTHIIKTNGTLVNILTSGRFGGHASCRYLPHICHIMEYMYLKCSYIHFNCVWSSHVCRFLVCYSQLCISEMWNCDCVRNSRWSYIWEFSFWLHTYTLLNFCVALSPLCTEPVHPATPIRCVARSAGSVCTTY